MARATMHVREAYLAAHEPERARRVRELLENMAAEDCRLTTAATKANVPGIHENH